jgi:hypothetical protein
MKYRVEMTAYVEAIYTLEIEADDEIEAKQLASERFPRRASWWNVLEHEEVLRVVDFDVEPAEEEPAR